MTNLQNFTKWFMILGALCTLVASEVVSVSSVNHLQAVNYVLMNGTPDLYIIFTSVRGWPQCPRRGSQAVSKFVRRKGISVGAPSGRLKGSKMMSQHFFPFGAGGPTLQND